jgi:hypothetical protein
MMYNIIVALITLGFVCLGIGIAMWGIGPQERMIGGITKDPSWDPHAYMVPQPVREQTLLPWQDWMSDYMEVEEVEELD